MSRILVAGLITLPIVMVLAVMTSGIVDDFKTNSGVAKPKVEGFMDEVNRYK